MFSQKQSLLPVWKNPFNMKLLVNLASDLMIIGWVKMQMTLSLSKRLSDLLFATDQHSHMHNSLFWFYIKGINFFVNII